MIIGHSVWNSAYATLIIQARMIGLDPSIEEAAADLGATPWRVFRRVTLSSLMPAIVAAGLLAFTFSFDDVVTSYFLQGTLARRPLPIVLFGLIRFRLTPEVNAIGVLVMLFTVALMSLAVTAFATAGRARALRAAARLPRHLPPLTWPSVRRPSVHKRFGDLVAVRQPRPRDRRGRVLLDHRAVRLRQDDDAADDRGLRGADERHDRRRRHAT